MTRLFKHVGSLLTGIGLWLVCTTAFAQQDELSVAIQPVDNGVEFVLTNNSSEAISLLRWETPLEPELTQDVFVVTAADGGNLSLHPDRAEFSGRLIKRGDPHHDDFISLAAGESLTSIVPLADYYELNNQGSHFVSFRGVFQLEPQPRSGLGDRSILSSVEGLRTVYMNTGAVMVDLTPKPEALYARAAGYSGCNATQLAELPGDFDASEEITREAREALENLPANERAGSPRYLRWFGVYSESLYDEVLDTYRKSEALMDRGEVEFLCDCDEPYYAFIRRTEPFKVNLCRIYWTAARYGTDSRAGTILHEVSHFNEIGGTEDHAYGAADVTALANSTPAQAVNNADSIEYFAENTPYLEISAGIVDPPEPEPEPEPETPVTFTPLQVGTSVNSSVAETASRYYQVTGADEIVLTSTSGDADLYVYTDEGISNQICSADGSTGVDSCPINSTGSVFVVVYGYTASSYTLVASTDSMQLQTGQVRTVSVGAGEQQFYTVSGANYVQINSLSGDADLYVFSSPDRDADSLVCDSRNFTANSTLDTCEVSGTSYISVFGVEGGYYTISSTTNDPRDPTVVPTGNASNSSSGGGGLIGASASLLMMFILALRRRLCILNATSAGASV